ncbi:MAG: DHH family phosphoesterase [Candidatus Magasanikbacteria bacterium]|jgi:phosphoesterase RecJ-like protein
MLTEIEQIKKLFADKKYVLIALAQNPDADAISSAVALKTMLEKQHKHVEIASAGFCAPANLNFILKNQTIKNELANLQKFIIKVDVSKSPIESLSYDVKDGWLSIYLSPKHGAITKNELRTAQTSFKYDLVITLDTVDLDALGPIFFNNTDLFYHTPVINIDHHASNEHFGQINLVNITATATAEIVCKMLEDIAPDQIDGSIATALLTGIIAKTKSFKTANVNPFTLNLAGHLMKLGAERDLIIQNLYRTRSLASLKLWGQALTNLQNDKELGLISTAITRDDFTRLGADENDIKGIIDELLSNSPEAKMVLLLLESIDDIKIVLTAEKEYDTKAILAPFSPVGDKKRTTGTIKGQSLAMAQNLIIAEIKKYLTKPN